MVLPIVGATQQTPSTLRQDLETLSPLRPKTAYPLSPRPHSRESALTRKSLLEPPSIHVVDGWAYAAVPTTLKYPGSKTISAASSSSPDLCRVHSNSDSSDASSKSKSGDKSRTMAASDILSSRRRYQIHAKTHSESSVAVMSCSAIKEPMPLNVAPKHTKQVINTAVTATDFLTATATSTSTSTSPSSTLVASDDAQTLQRTLELSEKIHRVRPRTDSRRLQQRTRTLTRRRPVVMNPDVEVNVEVDTEKKENSVLGFSSTVGACPQIQVRVDVERVVTTLSDELEEKAKFAQAVADSLNSKDNDHVAGGAISSYDTGAGVCRTGSKLRRRQTRRLSHPLPSVPDSSSTSPSQSDLPITSADDKRDATQVQKRDTVDMSIERQFMLAMAVAENRNTSRKAERVLGLDVEGGLRPHHYHYVAKHSKSASHSNLGSLPNTSYQSLNSRSRLHQIYPSSSPSHSYSHSSSNLLLHPHLYSHQLHSHSRSPSSHAEKMKKIQIVRKRLGEGVPAELVFRVGGAASIGEKVEDICGDDDVREEKEEDVGDEEVRGRTRRRNLNGISNANGSLRRDEKRFGRFGLDEISKVRGVQSESKMEDGRHAKVHSWLESTSLLSPTLDGEELNVDNSRSTQDQNRQFLCLPVECDRNAHSSASRSPSSSSSSKATSASTSGPLTTATSSPSSSPSLSSTTTSSLVCLRSQPSSSPSVPSLSLSPALDTSPTSPEIDAQATHGADTDTDSCTSLSFVKISDSDSDADLDVDRQKRFANIKSHTYIGRTILSRQHHHPYAYPHSAPIPVDANTSNLLPSTPSSPSLSTSSSSANSRVTMKRVLGRIRVLPSNDQDQRRGDFRTV